ncbi:MAG: class D sortase [Anaerolineae bacterium]|nr:class D sortase [Anaerolineae bacterium]
MRDRRYVQDLTIEELEHELLIRKREDRLTRLRRLGVPGAVPPSDAQLETLTYVEDEDSPDAPRQRVSPRSPAPKSSFQVWRERILLAIEIGALIGLVIVIVSFVTSVRRLNQDWKEEHVAQPLPTPTATALIRAAILPGGHRPPAISGGEAEPLAQMAHIAVATPGPHSPTRLIIPAINVDVPVVEGVDWEQLKKGAGHLIGSANPGERGNCFIAGHNDVYGEIFRDLEELKVGDEILVHAGARAYRYTVSAARIVEPDDVSVMEPTSTPILTLLTCYPYMIDSHRLVVIAELDM